MEPTPERRTFTGTPADVGAQSGEWLLRWAERPVVRRDWLGRGQVAHRDWTFADTGEVLCYGSGSASGWRLHAIKRRFPDRITEARTLYPAGRKRARPGQESLPADPDPTGCLFHHAHSAEIDHQRLRSRPAPGARGPAVVAGRRRAPAAARRAIRCRRPPHGGSLGALGPSQRSTILPRETTVGSCPAPVPQSTTQKWNQPCPSLPRTRVVPAGAPRLAASVEGLRRTPCGLVSRPVSGR